MSAPPERNVNKWIVALTVMLPTLIEIIDTSIVNVSLDHIRGSLSAGMNEATWAISSYLLSNAIVIPMSGWFSRLFGRKRYQMGSIALFTISSFLCGSAWSLESLIFFRIVQGLAGGGLVPVSQAILLEAFPRKEHGMAMALFGVGAMFGPIMGPLLGGVITDSWSWRWIFYINIPIGALAIFLSFLFIHDPPYMRRRRMGIDYAGFALLAVGLGSLQYVLDTGQRSDWFGSETIVTFTLIAAVAILFFIINERYHEHPIVNLRLFRDRSFTSGCIVMFFVFFNLFGSIVLLPIFLQVLMGYTSFQAGLVLGPGGLASLFTMPIVGKLVTRVNPKRILATGIVICAGTTYAMSLFNMQTNFWSFVLPRITLGIGLGCIFIPTTTLTLSHIPRENMGEATSLYNMIRNLGGSMGIAFATTMATRRAQFHQARLVEHLDPFNINYLEAKARISALLSWKGAQGASPDAGIYRELIRQSNMLGFNDAFFVVAVTLISVLGLVLIMQRPEEDTSGPGPGH
ncbi:MAG: DHA2 family efflux MFS transporter permease subunit [bacterium]|nr:MAG: DHA2 family efflux MFS transporter permease subunit [bacterium]